MMRRSVPPPGEDSELRRDFPQYVRALAEVYGVLSEAASDLRLNQMIISKNPQFTGISARQQLEFTTHLLLTD